MKYAIGKRDYNTAQGHKFIIEKDITKDEYENHVTRLSEAQKINSMENVHNLLIRNGNEYLKYSSLLKGSHSIDEQSIYIEANRLIINYLSSLSMFIDYGERYHSKYFGKAKMKEFQAKSSFLYDSHVSYRFMALMRNYALHYGFPLTEIQQSIEKPRGIFASKETLLKFKGWKHAEEDIKEMKDLISLDQHVEISRMFIKSLYDSYVYNVAPLVLKGIEYLDNLIRDNGGKNPFLATYKNEEELKKGNITINVIEIKPFNDALKIIRNHPSINLIEK